jgi:CRP/FNR family transcriptional regulator, cyclic AMP receptor protein
VLGMVQNDSLDHHDKMILIRNYHLFSKISEEDYEALNLVHNFLEAKKGDYIYFEAEFLNKLFFIKDGYIKIGYIDNNGNEVIREILQKGEIFGQFTLEKNNMNFEFARVHKADVSLCAFNVDSFQQLLSKNNHLAISFCKQVGNKLRKVESRLLNLLKGDVNSRLHYFFKELIQDNLDGLNGHHFSIENFLTHEDIAQLIGSSRQTVTNALLELANKGLIEFNRKQIIIPDISKL